MTHSISGLGTIKASLNGLSPKLREIAQYILDNPKQVVHNSISELAESTNCSETTIFRLCKQLRFQGFQDLKISIAKELVDIPAQNIHEAISTNDTKLVALQKVFQSHINGLQDTMHLINESDLEQAISLLSNASKIEFYGNGGSAAVALDSYHKFMRIGIPCSHHIDTHFQIMSASLLQKNTTVIAISHSGINKDLLNILKIAKDKGAKIIAITSYQKSTLSQVADITLYTPTKETELRTEASSSRLAQLALLDALFIGVSIDRQDEVLENLHIIRKAISKKRL